MAMKRESSTASLAISPPPAYNPPPAEPAQKDPRIDVTTP